ncbi:MAG: DUF3301 domain-containing protein [Methylobacter sp.]
MSYLIILISLLVLGFLYWNKSQQIKEIALSATRAHCLAMGVQMLDDYIAINTLGFKRNKAGKMQMQCSFVFEFSSTGDERYNGRIDMLGHRVESIYMEPYRIESD